jgi:hypothetical protein
VFDLDATQTASYGGTGQTWKNLVTAPADGSPRSQYDFYRGTTSSAYTDDPTFNGTAGAAAAYWSFDGGDWFDSVNADAGLLSNLHRTDASRPCTLGLAFRTPASFAEAVFIGTENSSTEYGFRIRTYSTSGNIAWVQSYGSGSYKTNNILPNGVLATNTDYLIFIALNCGGTGSEKVWKNSLTGASWAQALAVGTTSIAASNKPSIGARANAHGNALGNGYRLYGVYLFNEIIDDTKAASLYAALNTRHGRTYA